MSRSLISLGAVVLVLIVSSARAEDKKDEPKFKLSDDEKKLLDLVNKEREKLRLLPLQPDERLFKAARAHAANMAKQEKLEHDLDGKGVGKRIEEAGYPALQAGENISLESVNDVKAAVKGWMGSKGHRESILSKAFTDNGIGIARSARGEYYYVQVFAAEKITLTDEERKVFDLTNEERKKAKLPALTINPRLMKAARGHSANMAKKGFFEHVLDGKTWGDRAKDAGYDFEVCGENVGSTSGGANSKAMMKWWMESKDHRENIVRDEFTEIGVAAVKAADDKVYYTQLFAAPFKD
jgi:uncharacterized protein YkwD